MYSPRLDNETKVLKVIQENRNSIIELCEIDDGKCIRKTIGYGPHFKHEFAIATIEGLPTSIITCYDFNVTTKQLLYEYCEGGDLYDYLHPSTRRRRKVSQSLIATIIQDVATALQSFHELGIVHRDIKLENVLLTYPSLGEVRVKLCDFSFCEFYRENPDDRVAHLGCLKRTTKTFLGTIGYMAPELINKNADATPASDIFSLGVVFFELLSSHSAFTKEDTEDLKFYLRADQLNFPTGTNRTVKHFVKKMLSPDPENRPSATEVITFVTTWKSKLKK